MIFPDLFKLSKILLQKINAGNLSWQFRNENRAVFPCLPAYRTFSTKVSKIMILSILIPDRTSIWKNEEKFLDFPSFLAPRHVKAHLTLFGSGIYGRIHPHSPFFEKTPQISRTNMQILWTKAQFCFIWLIPVK